MAEGGDESDGVVRVRVELEASVGVEGAKGQGLTRVGVGVVVG